MKPIVGFKIIYHGNDLEGSVLFDADVGDFSGTRGRRILGFVLVIRCFSAECLHPLFPDQVRAGKVVEFVLRELLYVLLGVAKAFDLLNDLIGLLRGEGGPFFLPVARKQGQQGGRQFAKHMRFSLDRRDCSKRKKKINIKM